MRWLLVIFSLLACPTVSWGIPVIPGDPASGVFESARSSNAPQDHLGSIRVLTDEDGGVTERTTWGPWGERLEGGELSRVGYTGHSLDRESGLHYAVHRYLDPRNVRWTRRDPLGEVDGTNVYGYVRNRPTRFADPTGLISVGFSGFLEDPSTTVLNRYRRRLANLVPGSSKLFHYRDLGGSERFLRSGLRNSCEPIVIYGYSLGGDSATRLANSLASNPIPGHTGRVILITLDPVSHTLLAVIPGGIAFGALAGGAAALLGVSSLGAFLTGIIAGGGEGVAIASTLGRGTFVGAVPGIVDAAYNITQSRDSLIQGGILIPSSRATHIDATSIDSGISSAFPGLGAHGQLETSLKLLDYVVGLVEGALK